MGKVKEMRLSIQSMLIIMISNMGMDTPQNIEDITDFVFEDVQETADPNDWHSGDVAIAFRRWIEAQGTQQKMCDGKCNNCNGCSPKPKTIGVIGYGDQIGTVGELRKLMSDLDANDIIVIQSIDLETGDAKDLYPMNLDVIEGVRLNDKSIVREVRFCQMMNSVPDTRDKQPVIDALITELVNGVNGYENMKNILQQIPFETLLHSLPEKDWVKYKYVTQNIWKEIKSVFEDNTYVFIDAWLSDDDNEGGSIIAKIKIKTKEVEYIDQRAKTNKYAQEVIQECLKSL